MTTMNKLILPNGKRRRIGEYTPAAPVDCCGPTIVHKENVSYELCSTGKRRRIGEYTPAAPVVDCCDEPEPMDWEIDISHLNFPLACIEEDHERLPTIMESPEEEDGDEGNDGIDFGHGLDADDDYTAVVDGGLSRSERRTQLPTSGVRRSLRLATRGLGSATTASGRRYSLRLAGKKRG